MIDIFDNLFDVNNLNTLLFHNSYAKLYFTSLAILHFNKTIYIDLDTTFTAFCKTNLKLFPDLQDKKFTLYTLDEDELEYKMYSMVSNIPSNNLVIIDSINSLYYLSYKNLDTTINLFKEITYTQNTISNFLMLLLSYCKSFSIPILVTCMLKRRQKMNNHETWIKKPVNHRFFEKKSKTIFYIDIYSSKLILEILSHNSIPHQTLILKDIILDYLQ